MLSRQIGPGTRREIRVERGGEGYIHVLFSREHSQTLPLSQARPLSLLRVLERSDIRLLTPLPPCLRSMEVVGWASFSSRSSEIISLTDLNVRSRITEHPNTFESFPAWLDRFESKNAAMMTCKPARLRNASAEKLRMNSNKIYDTNIIVRMNSKDGRRLM